LRNPRGLAYKIAENINKKCWRTKYLDVDLPIGGLAILSSENAGDDESSRTSRRECQRHCLKKLDAPEQAVVVRYYHKAADRPTLKAIRRDLARDAGISIENLRRRVWKISQKLEACVEDCERRREERGQ
jgi:hypothetical protein